MVTTNHPPVRHAGRIRATARYLADVLQSARLALKAAHYYQRLSMLADRQLAEQGLSCQTLPQQVFASYLRY